MAPTKRGAAPEDAPRKKQKHFDASDAPKRQHPANLKAVRDSSNRTPSNQEKKVSTRPSVLQTEERAFPRGGASVLTPLEHKQIQIQATRDVLFEQNGGSKPGPASDEEENAEQDTAITRPASKKRKRNKFDKQEDTQQDAPGVKIEGLSYKRLVPGSMVLGQVSAITSRELVLALPNNISGFVPITQISDQINARIEKLLEQDDDEDEEQEEDQDDVEDVSIQGLNHIGQYLRAYVTSTEEETESRATKKARRKIELSINPRLANSGLKSSDIAAGMMVSASVVSVEDHGVVMDLGLEDRMSAFVSAQELGAPYTMEGIEEGAVMLCIVTSTSNSGKMIKLSADLQKAGNLKKANFVKEASNIDSFLPGTAVEMLVTETNVSGIAGKVMGMLDATADLIHSGAGTTSGDLAQRFPIGKKMKARIICTFPTSSEKKVGVSVLDHILSFSRNPGSRLESGEPPLKELPISSFVESAKVRKVRPGVGIFMDVGIKSVRAFAHISRLSDKKVEMISEESGPYKVGSVHRARVVGYNAVDGLYLVSLEQKILDQPFLRVADLRVGQAVKGRVEKLVINERGVGGVLINLAEGITGLVPEMHMADVQLQHPERKFKEGMAVSARVLSTDPEKDRVRLTLKKTLVNSEGSIWDNYDHITIGEESLGSIVKILPSGAVMQFYGDVRAFLPVAQMSDTFIKDPTQHFRIGQAITVRALEVDAAEKRMTVSCRIDTVLGSAQDKAFTELSIGSIVEAMVTEKSLENITLTLDGSELRATLHVEQLTDGSEQKNTSTLKRIRVGQKLQDLVVLDKREQRHLVELSNKPSLVKAARSGTLVCRLEDLKGNMEVNGFVRNITLQGVFVQFGGGLTGLLFKSQIEDGAAKLPNFGLRIGQSISATVLTIDQANQRFLLSQRGSRVGPEKSGANSAVSGGDVVNAVDGVSKTIMDYAFGKATKARITGVKETQINVQLADNVQGRVDVSEAFDTWEDIKDRKHPLRVFRAKQVIDVTVLGIHDARNHRFLPITHRVGKVPVFELSAKSNVKLQTEADIVTLAKVKEDTTWVAYVNNISERCVWVNLSPNVRGRIDIMDLSDDVSLLNDLEEHFPVGSAMKVHVKAVDTATQRLDLVAAGVSGAKKLSLDDLSEGMILPGRIAKINERELVVQLSDGVSGIVALTELADDFSKANLIAHNKNDVVRVSVLDVDQSNKRVHLSMRPSKVLSSSLPVKDPYVASISQLKVNDVVRGFVKNVIDQGMFVALSPLVTAFVRISDLSDAYIKDWKAAFEIGQLVKAKVISVDETLNHVQLSLKASLLDKDYVPPVRLADLKAGQIVTGKVRKVEDFGVFILVDNSNNLSGLCHRSEMADGPVDDVRVLYSEGDCVKAIVLKVDLDKRRVNFGLKASYMQGAADADDSEDDEDVSNQDGGVLLQAIKESSDEEMEDQTEGLFESDEDTGDDDNDDMSVDGNATAPINGLSTGGFDWTGGNDDAAIQEDAASDLEVADEPKKKKRRRAEVKIDKTGDLDKYGPQSVADYERQLLGQPNSSSLWIQYMAFHLQLNEVDRAREIADRALKNIHIREEDEKLNVWVALLNLENAYGSEETLEDAFKRACQYNDTQEMHERLASIYIDSGKHDKADDLFQAMTRNKAITANPSFWLNYATFLMTTLSAANRARALLPRALQSVPQFHHRQLTSKFGALEFQSPNGDAERGRTIFEGLLDSFPKRWDLWDMFIDLEKGHGDASNVRGLFERMSGMKMKKRRAAFLFKRWLEFEQAKGDARSVERVRAKAAELDRDRDGDDEA